MTDVSLALDYLPQLPLNRDVPIGCIGSGFIMADCQLVAYRQAGFKPVAIASQTREKAQAVADRHGLQKVYDHYEQLLDDSQLEVIDIAVPPDIQVDVVRAAVRRKHIRGILAQKPLGMNYAQAVEIVRLCADAGIVQIGRAHV